MEDDNLSPRRNLHTALFHFLASYFLYVALKRNDVRGRCSTIFQNKYCEQADGEGRRLSNLIMNTFAYFTYSLQFVVLFYIPILYATRRLS
ncbi:hypothetical protein K450DRAFT_217387 [Umbelopsis ramanniana AG]|uniref:Uncharacterized protein n=1 Tax=Umbelopsis ramanniana AG TaxID=1314678 RepID=A0AAD5EIX0_UMBRA|nr:uncharacterized protein K450DRAFT_217387 [Umbelopsis ramanniana AG]KAI8584668.1 hypothetical protein K450DRAFT_217387 [Umbelopsis ramanniana AG]